MKGIGLTQLTPIAVLLVVAFFIFSIGLVMMNDLQENFCEYTWVEPGTYDTSGDANGNNTATNPVTSGEWGCCLTANTTDCVTWYTVGYAINASHYGSESLTELADWGPTLALVVIAALIIGVLMTYLSKSG